jgi:ATP-binding cassette subfamily C (CFTR/MRP) protein 1
MQGSEKVCKLLVCSILIGKYHYSSYQLGCLSERFILPFLTGNSPVTIAPFATLVTYAIISIARADGALQVAQAFTSLALISLVAEPLLRLCQALSSLTQAISCFSRIEAFFLINPAYSSSEASLDDHSTPQNDVQLQVMPSSDSLFVFEDVTITWSPDDSLAALHGLSLTIRPGFTAVIGPVGAGKTTLLSSIIGQTALRCGLISPSLSGVAYCSHIPWIIDDTIERNISGDSEFDQKWFQFSLTCCSLNNDIDSMPAGYNRIAGTDGSSLSGGQKQRVVSL